MILSLLNISSAYSKREESENAPRMADEICRTCNRSGGLRARKGAVYSNYRVTLLENLTRGEGERGIADGGVSRQSRRKVL